jgi:hypothetical protein
MYGAIKKSFIPRGGAKVGGLVIYGVAYLYELPLAKPWWRSEMIAKSEAKRCLRELQAEPGLL